MDSIENRLDSQMMSMPTGLREYKDFFTKLFEDSPSISSLEDLAHHFSLQLASSLANLSAPLSSIRQLILTEIDTKEYIIKEFEDLYSDFNTVKASSKDLRTPSSFPSVKIFLDSILNNFTQVLKIYSEVLNRYMNKITKKKDSQVIKSLGRARSLHENTEGIDKELQRMQSELSSRNPSMNSTGMSIDEKLLYENYELKQKLIQTESSLLHLNCELMTKGDSLKTELLSQKIKTLNSEVNKLSEQKQEMSLLVENLKSKNSRLLRALSAQETLKDKIRSLNFAFSAQGKRIEQIRNSKSIRSDTKPVRSKDSSTPQIQSIRPSFSTHKTEIAKNAKRKTTIETTRIPEAKVEPKKPIETKNPFENPVSKAPEKTPENRPTKNEGISDSSAKIIEELRSSQAKLIHELQEKEKFILELKETNAEYIDRLQEYEEVFKQEDSILKESEQQLTEALDNNQQYMIKINGLTEEIAQTKEAFLQVKIENTRLVEENSILYEEKSVLLEEHEELQKIKEMSYVSLHKMMSESEIIKVDEPTFNEEPILEQMNTINDLKEELEFAKKRCQESKTKMFEYQESMQEALEENEKLKKIAQESTSKISGLTEEVHNLMEQKNEIADSLAIAEETIRELQITKENNDSAIRELNKKVRSLESLIVELKSKKS